MKKRNYALLCGMCIFLLAAFLHPGSVWAEKSAKSITLTYTLHTPPPPKWGGTNDQASIEYWAKQIEAQTQGRVKFRMFYGGVLGKVTDFVKMVGGTGVADVGNIIGSYNQWTLPLFAGAMNPFLTTGIDTEARAITKLYNEWAPMREEWTKHNLKPLWWYVIDPYSLAIKKEIKGLEDLQGDKIWAAGGFAEIVKMYRITPVFFPATQVYEALQKGTIDGIIFPHGPISIFKFHEVANVLVDLGFMGCQTPSAQAINLDVWNKISPADQKTIERISAGMHEWFLNYTEKDKARLDKLYRSKGVKFISFSPEEQSKIKDKCAEAVWADWIKKAEGKGIPAKEFLRRYRAAVAEVSK